VNGCKQKCTNFRNSFARHLRKQNRPFFSRAKNKSKKDFAGVSFAAFQIKTCNFDFYQCVNRNIQRIVGKKEICGCI
jgi:hypothetical protein